MHSRSQDRATVGARIELSLEPGKRYSQSQDRATVGASMELQSEPG